MGLFQRQQFNNEAPLYTMGGQETYLIIGLGNIGKEYDNTRHNIGFECVDYLAEKINTSSWIVKKDLKIQESSGTLDGQRIILAKPTTLMNNSGEAVSATQRFYRVDDAHTLVIHDELDIDFGKIRVRKGGSDAGNNGVKSLIQYGSGDTWRLRCGIGPKTPEQMDSADFVLSKFSKAQQSELEKILKGSLVIANEFIFNKGNLESETRSFL